MGTAHAGRVCCVVYEDIDVAVEERIGLADGHFDRLRLTEIAEVGRPLSTKLALLQQSGPHICELGFVVIDQEDAMTLVEKQSAKASTYATSRAGDDEVLGNHSDMRCLDVRWRIVHNIESEKHVQEPLEA